VTARGFGPPPVTAECAAPFLRLGGHLVVSEPRDGEAAEDRWPEGPLAGLGLTAAGEWRDPFHYRRFRQATPCPATYPRRTGQPAKRPLF
jgi:16S rRNA (guanine527-N7)-methyltransferase